LLDAHPEYCPLAFYAAELRRTPAAHADHA
jgi:hypothetical protein